MRPVLVTFVFAVASFGQGSQPAVTNAKFETQAFSGNLNDVIRSGAPHWFGYAVKTAPRGEDGCCWGNGNGYGCGLEGRSSGAVPANSNPKPIELEGPSELGILIRVENGVASKIQVYSLRCPLDAGGLPFTWLTGVSADASLHYLESQASSSATR